MALVTIRTRGSSWVSTSRWSNSLEPSVDPIVDENQLPIGDRLPQDRTKRLLHVRSGVVDRITTEIRATSSSALPSALGRQTTTMYSSWRSG
jgi:hypothetical protein